jgi:hypothetical protein
MTEQSVANDTAPSNDVERLLIERACERLCLEYARLIDLGRAAEVIGLFTDDAELTLTAGPMQGRDQISTFLVKRQAAAIASRHVITNVTIDIHSATEASGVAYITLYRREHSGDGPAPLGPPNFVGHYDDEFVLTDAGWRFRRRTSNIAFQG